MEKKHRQPSHREMRWLHYRAMESQRHQISRFLQTQKQQLLTGFLLVSIVVLLFGIFSQLPPPMTSAPPDGVTVVDYSSFVRQVQARHVLAVVIEGNNVHGLLASPFVQHSTKGASLSPRDAADIAVWEKYVRAGYPAPWQVSEGTLPPSQTTLPSTTMHERFIYTCLPAQGDRSLISLLLNSHVVVTRLPAAPSLNWGNQFWNSLLLMGFALLAMMILVSPHIRRPSHFRDHFLTRLEKKSTLLHEHEREIPDSRSAAKTASTSAATKQVADETENTHEHSTPSVTFGDVAGVDEVRVEVEEIVQFLRSPEHFRQLGARLPRGALLVGPPGTGKTLFAKAVAGEAGVPFFNVSASELVEIYAGMGARRVRSLFQLARQSAPCVIFLDELDAVGPKRSMSMRRNEERDQTLNQLLIELDGFERCQSVVVLAATNRADILDPALLRPGRFDRRITLSLPDRAGREAILKVHTRATPLHEDVSLVHLSRLTTGMSGADLANLVNEAALTAARHDRTSLTKACFEEALARVQLGALRTMVMSEADRRVMAYHEGGHALVSYYQPQADSVNYITILPRGKTLGVTQFTTVEDHYHDSRETLMARIAVGLGGRVAEELAFGPSSITTGAENDLQMVSALALQMVTRWGMSERLGVLFAAADRSETSLNMCAHGLLTYDGEQRTAHHFAPPIGTSATPRSSAMWAALIDSEMQCLLREGYAIARTVLSAHYEQLSRLAEELIEREQLDRSQLETFLQTDG